MADDLPRRGELVQQLKKQKMLVPALSLYAV